MSRPASDIYTRFTSTSPHASSKVSPSSFISSTITGSYQPPRAQPSKASKFPPGPPNETPQEKVARLRAAARLARAQAALSPVDRLIEGGRRVADRLHRITVYGLMGFSGIATLVAIYAGVDLVRHNRRQKRAWIDRELQRLYDARKAFVRGDATPEQLHLLQQERAGDEMVEKAKREKERKRRESWWGRGKAALGLGPKGELTEMDEGRVESRGEEVMSGEGLSEEGGWAGAKHDGMSVTEGVRNMVEEKGRAGEKQVEQISSTRGQGGPLDAEAGNVTGAVKEKMEWTGWLHWGRGGGS